jgi:hypothetical protein
MKVSSTLIAFREANSNALFAQIIVLFLPECWLQRLNPFYTTVGNQLSMARLFMSPFIIISRMLMSTAETLNKEGWSVSFSNQDLTVLLAQVKKPSL